jgi:hypothetical protein
MHCPNCLADLPTNQNSLFFACPKCNFLLFKHENNIKQVDELDIQKKCQQTSRFKSWICSKILKHAWSDEGYITADHKAGCIKSQVCTRCFTSTTKIESHEFFVKYLHENSCEAQYICKKCGVQDQDSAKWRSGKWHSWSEWVVDTKNKFPRRESRKCKRCGLQDHKVIEEDTWRQD